MMKKMNVSPESLKNFKV